MWKGVEARDLYAEPYTVRDICWVEGEGLRGCLSLKTVCKHCPCEMGISPKSPPQEKKKNVFDQRGKLPGQCGIPKDRLGAGRCADAGVTMWESLKAQMRVVHRHKFSSALSILLSKAQLWGQPSHILLPHAAHHSSPNMLPVSTLKSFPLSFKTHTFLCPRLGLLWYNK